MFVPGVAEHERARCADTLEQVRAQLRIVQNKTGCATSVLNLVLEKLKPYLKGVEKHSVVKMRRVRARQKNEIKQQLHGCVGCHGHVFGPSCRVKQCPQCGHPRYDRRGNPHEVISYCCALGFVFKLVVCMHFYVACVEFLTVVRLDSLCSMFVPLFYIF